LNHETLAQLREMMPETAVRQILEAIIADLGRRTDALELAIALSDWAEVRRLGHTIKGGASMAGATQVARLGAKIESCSVFWMLNSRYKQQKIVEVSRPSGKANPNRTGRRSSRRPHRCAQHALGN
jgi:HPt (histidine-containing phosphotransfer) domain-containing protein